jgi:hypothetical protein
MVRNVSDDSATGQGDVWVQACDDCSFATEPPGFVKHPGQSERARHRTFQNLNPGVSLETFTIDIASPRNVRKMDVGMWYSCEHCKGGTSQMQRITITKIHPYMKQLFH